MNIFLSLISIIFFSLPMKSSAEFKPEYRRFCDSHFIGFGVDEDCEHLLENNRFFITDLMFCARMLGNSQKTDCLMTVANKMFPRSVLERCMRHPFSARCLGGQYVLIPQKDASKVIIFNCINANLSFSMKDDPDDPWKHVSLPPGGMLSEPCRKEDCKNNPIKVSISIEGKSPQYNDLPFGEYYIIKFDEGEQLFRFFRESINMICL